MSLAEPAAVETDAAPPGPATNAAAYSVSELAFALKRTLEDAYGHVRLRGEISKVTRHASGHVYLSIKDDKACIDGVIWKSVRGIAVRPETGMEVIVTGRITTYPGRSQYQILIETLEPAGVGALLAQLERLKTKLNGEGLFAPDRKQPIPPSPAVIGVITSPTGAVIRDILHRLRERWPCRVLLWPVVVQGEGAAAQVCAALRGFDALPASGGALPRPDVVIVARGGGSVEDLWPFNDEALARTVAACRLPVISAVGHETDTTLIDFVADRRAPTPTAAAEMATPVLAELAARVGDSGRRMARCSQVHLERARTRLTSAARGLPRPDVLLGLAEQRFDAASGRLLPALTRNTEAHGRDLLRAAARLSPALLERPLRLKAERLDETDARLHPAAERRLARAADRLDALGKLHRAVDPERPLDRGFALVRRPAGGPLVRTAAELAAGEAVELKFRDGVRTATADGGDAASVAAPSVRVRRPAPSRPAAPHPVTQGSLF